MKKVLIISPHFPPVNAPDMQRVRLALPHLRRLGWEPVVLALTPDSVEGAVIEPLLEKTYPSDIRVIRVRGIAPRTTRRLGFGSLWLRCGARLRAAGEALLRSEHFDLVFLSTTQFDAFPLGPLWRQRFGVPYVLDYQDPWYNSYYDRTGTRPPGGRLKFAFAQWRASRQEPAALRHASGIIAVSDAYGPSLAERHPGFDPRRVTLLPFGAASSDFAVAQTHRPADPLVNFDDGCIHHVYTGRCGPDMTISLSIVFEAFKHFLRSNPEVARCMRFHFIGTDYAPPPLGREWVMPHARRLGVEPYVHEHTTRVPYFDALYYLRHADALLAVGSNDPTYSASKIFPYMLAERPMLVIYNRTSPILAFAKQAGCGQRHEFTCEQDTPRVALEVADRWFADGGYRRVTPSAPEFLDQFCAPHMTERLAEVFDHARDGGLATP